jgi:hypothetical protein
MVTNLMSRLTTDKKWFKTEVLDVPVLNSYWERMQARPSYKDAGQHCHVLWSTTKANMVLFFNLAFMAAILFGILELLGLFMKHIEIGSDNWYWYYLGCFVAATIMFFAWLSMKGRTIWKHHQQL